MNVIKVNLIASYSKCALISMFSYSDVWHHTILPRTHQQPIQTPLGLAMKTYTRHFSLEAFTLPKQLNVGLAYLYRSNITFFG